MSRSPQPPWQEVLVLPPNLATVTADTRPAMIIKDAAGEWWVNAEGDVAREAAPDDVLRARRAVAVGRAG